MSLVSEGRFTLEIFNPDGNLISEISGSPVSAFLESKDIDFGSRRAWKYMDGLIVELERCRKQVGEEVRCAEFQIGYRNSLDEIQNWQLLIPLKADGLIQYLRLNARLYKIRIGSAFGSDFWRLGAVEFVGNKFGESW